MATGGHSMFSFFDLLTGGASSMHRHGGGGGQPKCKSHVVSLKVNLETLYNGETKTIPITRKIICKQCNGSGGKSGKKLVRCTACHGQGVRMGMTRLGPLMIQQPVQCRECQGEGEIRPARDMCTKCHGKKVVEEQKTLDVVILPGFTHGKKIKFKSEYDQMPDMEPGDIIVIIEQEKHSIFERINDDDLLIKMKINLAESLTGFERIIKHLDGRNVLIKHPPNQPILPDSFKRVNNQGMISMERHHTGDLLIHFDIEFPRANFLNDPNLIKSLETLLPAKSIVKIPVGVNIDDASPMIECQYRPSPKHNHHHNESDNDYMDCDDDDDDDDNTGHPHVQTCHTQ